MNFPVVSGGFALLATTGALAAGLGGPAGAAAGGAAVGALTVGGVVTGLVPLVAAGALGVLGEKYRIIFMLKPTSQTPAILCHKEPPLRIQSPQPFAQRWFFVASERLL